MLAEFIRLEPDGWSFKAWVGGTNAGGPMFGGIKMERLFQAHPNRKDGSVGCKVTLNGNPSSLGELRTGDFLEIDGRPAKAITATRK